MKSITYQFHAYFIIIFLIINIQTFKSQKHKQMYISGIAALDKKKTNLKLASNPKIQSRQPIKIQQEQRPYSPQYDLLQLKPHYSIEPSKKNIQIRQLSQNKITIKRLSQKKIVGKSVNKTTTDKEQSQKYKLEIRDKNKDKQKDKEKQSGFTIKTKFNKRKNTDSIGTIRINQQQMAKIVAYFRYLPISILSNIGLREQFMKILSQQQDVKPFNPFKKPTTKKQITQFLQKLHKQAQLKGKYKYREKYNYSYCAQLKALQYKRKQYKKKKQSSSSQSDDDKLQKCRDMQTWKKAMGIDGNGKVFIIKGKYPDLRNALTQRGWVQNSDKKSNFYDMKWTTKISDVNFAILKPNQMVNHFDNNACLTSKYGLIKSIRSVMYPQNMDIDRFFPKAYDLSDLSDFQNFLEMFKWITCESILKSYYYDIQTIKIEKVKIAIIVTQRRLTCLQNVLKYSSGLQYQFCSINQWNFLNDKPCDQQDIQKTVSTVTGDFKDNVSNLLQRLEQKQPQFKLNGFRNIWIVKPAFLSRGRGIKCLANLTDILDTSLGKQTQYVVQKYIQNPLIINKRKFDIRVWVLVQDYNPPKIWFYNQFYLRFCLQDYNTQALKNRYAHLTNNSVQKYNTKVGSVDLERSMWDRQTFQKYITDNYGQNQFKILLGKMKQIVIATILGTMDQVSGRKGSFQQMGYDMMIDQNLNPWLIEVNSSPAMDYSTPITRKLVKMVMQDIVKIVVDLRKKKNKTKNAGQFKCIYSGEIQFKNKYYSIGQANKNQQ